MFFEGIRSERQLMRHAADRLSVLWYLGYDLNEPLPDHSSLTRIRSRYGVDVFRRFFEQIVEQCQQAGLVWGRELYIDGTKVQANASRDSLKPRFFVEKHLRELFASKGEEAPACAADAEPPLPTSEDGALPPEVVPGKMTLTNKVQAPSAAVCEPTFVTPVQLPVLLEDTIREDLTKTNEQRHDWIEQLGAQDRRITSRGYQRMADYLVSTTRLGCDAHGDYERGRYGLPHALCGRWRQSSDHPECFGDPFGSDG